MDEHAKEVMERFLTWVKEADKETQEKMLCFCEGAVTMSTMIKEEGGRTA